MTRNFFLLIMPVNFFYCLGQSHDAGYRKIFLDENFVQVDSAEASHYGYSFFYRKYDFTGLSEIQYYNYPGNQWNYIGTYQAGHPFALNGTLWTVQYQRKTRYEFEEGYLKTKTACTVEGVDTFSCEATYYDSLYHNMPGTYFYQTSNAYDTTNGYFRDGKYGWDSYAEYDSRGLKYSVGKYPYWIGHVPNFIAIVAGVEGFKRGGYEVGLGANLAELGGDVYGGMGGFILTYKNRFDNSYRSFNAEVGAYLPLSLAIGYGYHTNGSTHTNSFKLVTGITLFHLQMLYSYNFYKNSTNEIPELFHHTFTLRYALPVLRISQ